MILNYLLFGISLLFIFADGKQKEASAPENYWWGRSIFYEPKIKNI